MDCVEAGVVCGYVVMLKYTCVVRVLWGYSASLA